MIAMPWVLAGVLSALLILESVLFVEGGRYVASAGYYGVLTVVRITLAGTIVSFAVLDLHPITGAVLRGFPTWVPLPKSEYALGIVLPAVGLASVTSTVLAGTVLVRSVVSFVGFFVALVSLLVITFSVSFIGLALNQAANWSTILVREVRPRIIGSAIKAALLFFLASMPLGLWLIPAGSSSAWFRPDLAISQSIGSSNEITGLASTLTGATIWIIIGWAFWRLWQRLLSKGKAETNPQSASAKIRSFIFPRDQIAAISLLETLNLVRNSSMVAYCITASMFFLFLITAVARQVLPLKHASAFLLLTFYFVVFLLAAVPLRSRGQDLPLNWFWKTAPVRTSSYIIGKLVVVTSVPTALLGVFFAIAVLTGGLRYGQGFDGGIEVFSFAVVAYSLAFVWGIIQPSEPGNVSSEISQVGGYALSAMLLFRLLGFLQPWTGGGPLVLAVLVLILMFGAALAAEEKRNGQALG